MHIAVTGHCVILLDAFATVSFQSCVPNSNTVNKIILYHGDKKRLSLYPSPPITVKKKKKKLASFILVDVSLSLVGRLETRPLKASWSKSDGLNSGVAEYTHTLYIFTVR